MSSAEIELSVVMPCLNEADTVGICVEKAVRAMREAGVVGEVVLADNGSADDSKKIAVANGARTIDVKQRGYGAALMACLLYTSPSPRDQRGSRMPSSA